MHTLVVTGGSATTTSICTRKIFKRALTIHGSGTKLSKFFNPGLSDR